MSMQYRMGQPRTEEERAQRHKELTGETVLPSRGARRATASVEDKTLWAVLLLAHVGLIAAEAYLAHKQGYI